MIRSLFHGATLLILVAVAAPLLSAEAQVTCGDIIEFDEGVEVRTPIADCDNPFGIPNINPDLVVTIDEEPITEDETYGLPFAPETASFEVFGSSAFFTELTLYRHQGDDFVLERGFIDGGPFSFEQEGTYTLVVTEQSPVPVHDDTGLLYRFVRFVTPVVHANVPPSLILTFDVVEGTVEPEIDPLLLQYEPILLLHPDENYRPMNIEAFVEASALWDDNGVLPDEQELEAGEVLIEDLADAGTEDLYLAFSTPNEAKSFDPDAAKVLYDELVTNGDTVPTYYARKMEDSYTDEEGVLHEFIVLQYWYFYAFNDWKAQLGEQGLNDHEGDWESVFVFLDKNSEEPQYVAYSAHLNDGNPTDSLFQYDSVRRRWSSDEVEKDGDQPQSFVAFGSHANYPNNGDDGNHEFSGLVDETSETGEQIGVTEWLRKENISEGDPEWMLYEGKWGADSANLTGGEDGPKGPNFLSSFFGGDAARFHEPIEWAGIDTISEKTVTEPIGALSFNGGIVGMVFGEDLPAGATILVDQFDEFITFGGGLDVIDFLPRFWDLESSLGNDLPTTTVTFAYDSEEVTGLGVDEENLGIFFYNEETGEWELVSSTLDTTAKTVSFVTTHFSRYAIGASEPENATPEELLQEFRDALGEMDIKKGIKRRLEKSSLLAQKFIERDKIRIAKIILRGMKISIEWRERRGEISEEDTEILLNIIQKLRKSLN